MHLTTKEIKNIMELIRIRRQEIAHSPHPSAYKEEYFTLVREEEHLAKELQRRYHAGNIAVFQPGREVRTDNAG